MLRRLSRFGILAAILAVSAGLAVAVSGLEQRWYWGGGGSAQLSKASRELAASLDAPVKLIAALPAENVLRRHVSALAASFRRIHPDVGLEFVDPRSSDGRARELGLVKVGEMLVRYGERYERVAAPSEARISAALERLLRRGERFIAWLQGHGERPVESQRNDGMGDFVSALERKGYTVLPLSLARTALIPDNAALLIVAGPQTPLQPGERELIADYLERGGAMLWLGEPGLPVSPPGIPSVTLAGGTVTDPKTPDLLAVEDTRVLLIDTAVSHPVMAALDAPLLLRGATAVRSEPESAWRRSELLRGASRQRLEGEQDTTDPTVPTLGLALARQHAGRRQRSAVLGDSDLFTSAYLGNGGNLAFGVSLVDWLVGADAYVGRYMAAATDQRLDLDRTDAVLLTAVSLAGIPGLLLLGAGAAWRRQRRG